MSKRNVLLAVLGVCLLASMVALAGGVTFTLNKDTVNTGEELTATFSEPLPAAGEKYWITVISAKLADSEWGEWKYVDTGAKSVSLKAPAAAGAYEVRLHANYPAKGYNVIARKSLTVRGGVVVPITFKLAKSAINAGEKPKVTFSIPLPKSGEKYWITVAPAGSADSEWGQWQYVDVGVESIELAAVPAAGKYEVRLHDQYPAMPYHVVFRQPLTVK